MRGFSREEGLSLVIRLVLLLGGVGMGTCVLGRLDLVEWQSVLGKSFSLVLLPLHVLIARCVFIDYCFRLLVLKSAIFRREWNSTPRHVIKQARLKYSMIIIWNVKESARLRYAIKSNIPEEKKTVPSANSVQALNASRSLVSLRFVYQVHLQPEQSKIDGLPVFVGHAR